MKKLLFFAALLVSSVNAVADDSRDINITASDVASLVSTLEKIPGQLIVDGIEASCTVSRTVAQVYPAADEKYATSMTVVVKANCSGNFDEAYLEKLEADSLAELLSIPNVSEQ